MDNRSNSRANTCAQSRLKGRDVFIRYKTNRELCESTVPFIVVIHNNCSDRIGV